MTPSIVTDEMIRAAWTAYWDSEKRNVNPTSNSGMRAAITAALSAMWRPISEAKRNGTCYILWFQDGHRPPVIGAFNCQHSWWEVFDEGSCEPTHFAPLIFPTPAIGER